MKDIQSILKSKDTFSTVVNDHTWSGWVTSYIVRQAESTLSAVWLAWSISRLFSPVVNSLMSTSLFKAPPGAKDNSNILTKLLNLYANGIEGLYAHN